jgi:AraC-like DNA-binding protein
MLYRLYTPPPPLSALVSCLWYAEGFDGAHTQERLLPNGESSIVFDLRPQPIPIPHPDRPAASTSLPASIFCGARTSCFVIATSAQERVAGIQFRPGGAFPFLGMPASEVAHDHFNLEDIWPLHTARIRERLLSALSPAAMFAILEEELLGRLKLCLRPSPQSGPSLHPAVAFAIQRLTTGLRVAEVADQAGLSSRRLIDLFQQQTGLAPKAFQRVRRFQQALRRMHRTREQEPASLAASCGYYDQAHFIHDFRTFSGMTPGEYAAVATPHLNHVPLS